VKTLGVAIVAIAVGVAAVLAVDAVRFDEAASPADLLGSTIAMTVTGAGLIALLYWPALTYFRRRLGLLSVGKAVAITVFGLNLPVYTGLLILGRNRELFAADEVLSVVVVSALIGAMFAAGFARVHRGPATLAGVAAGRR
jgi:hypothetical protein